MKFVHHSLVICIVLGCLLAISASPLRKVQREEKPQRGVKIFLINQRGRATHVLSKANKVTSTRRKYIIKCCGRAFCSGSSNRKRRNETEAPEIAISTEIRTEATVQQVDADLLRSTEQEVTAENEVSGTTTKFNDDRTLAETDVTPNALETTSDERPGNCEKECLGNGSLLNNQDDISKYGSFISVCNTNFLFGNRPLTWDENYDFCCSLGLEPLNIADEIEDNCLQNFVKSSWNLNYNYWSGGTSRGIWCPSNKRVGVKIVPNNGLDCLRMQVARNVSIEAPAISWTHRNCSWRYMPACRGALTPKRTVPECGVACKKNESLFTSDGNNLAGASIYGRWNKSCGNMFVFGAPSTNSSWSEAKCFCERIGMRSVSIESVEKMDCLKDLAGTDPFFNGSFWTSATDRHLPGTFTWCGRKQIFDENYELWGRNQPISSDTCVSLNLGEGILESRDCSKAAAHLCESPAGKNSTKMLQQECMNIFNISQAEIDSLLTAPSYTQNFKCFLRCIGENAGLIVNGVPVDWQIIKFVEAQLKVGDDETLQKDLHIYDLCNKNPVSDDACETAARLFKCGTDNAPDTVAEMIAVGSADLDTNMEGRGWPSMQPACPENLTCNTQLVESGVATNYLTDISNSNGYYFVSACGNFYLVLTTLMTFEQAHENCCKYGWRLAQFETNEELQCFNSANNDQIISTFKQDATLLVSAYNFQSSDFFSWCPSAVPLDNSFVYLGGQLVSNANRVVAVRLSGPSSASARIATVATFDTHPAICEKPI
ncbi:Hypothetical predicted protein [Cloeon dipterum]|uniref:C-type lectin domain-containing protein n=1 Tax=Cloeon dipterum TaxID=197152 RepID=A0A8S1E468_9INSE|nr:Hypothetical predicted protein [Cloeon dipterum]